MGFMGDFVINAALFRWPVVTDLSENLFQRVLCHPHHRYYYHNSITTHKPVSFVSILKKLSVFIKPAYSLIFSQQPRNGTNSEPEEWNPHRHTV
jgi:hypothetical protein